MDSNKQGLEARVLGDSRFHQRRYEGYRVTVQLERNNGDYHPTKIGGPGDVYSLMQDLQHETSEYMYELLLNAQNYLVGVYQISKGSTDATLVDPKEVFRPAILSNAVGIILVHNHPSGEPTPSIADAAVTRQIQEASDLLGFSLLDHIIIGEGQQYVSLADKGMLYNESYPARSRPPG